ncbi:MAG: hypothetical protein ACOH1P_02625 [Lysobacter sp.]
MSSQSFRFDQHFFQSRMRAAFAPRKPRNSLLRFLLGAVGLGLLVLLVAFGAVVGVGMLAVGLLYKLVRGRGKPVVGGHSHDPRVVEGEYRVVEKPTLPR